MLEYFGLLFGNLDICLKRICKVVQTYYTSKVFWANQQKIWTKKSDVFDFIPLAI